MRTCPTCRGLGVIPDVADLPPDASLPAGLTVPPLPDSLRAAADDAPTAKLPPIRDTVRRRPPVPEVRDLADRAELLEEMGRELRRELAELLTEDQDDARPSVPALCDRRPFCAATLRIPGTCPCGALFPDDLQ